MTYPDPNPNRDPLTREPLARDPLERDPVARDLEESRSGSFTWIALLLSVVAVVGIVAYSVSSRDNIARNDTPATTASRPLPAPATPPASTPATPPSTTGSSPAQ